MYEGLEKMAECHAGSCVIDHGCTNERFGI